MSAKREKYDYKVRKVQEEAMYMTRRPPGEKEGNMEQNKRGSAKVTGIDPITMDSEFHLLNPAFG